MYPLILLIGIPSEPPLQMVRQAVAELGARCVVFNQRHFDRYDMELEIRRGFLTGTLTLEHDEIALGEITGAYARPMDDNQLPELCGEPAHSARRQRCRSLHELLLRWLDIAPGVILNRPTAMASNSSKPYQSSLIQAYGFLIPETLITNDPAEVLRFHDKHHRIVFKSISGARSIVTEFGREHVARIDLIRQLPTQFQQRVDGFDVRVHVIGEKLYAARALSSATDYRYSARQGGSTRIEAFALPSHWEERCIALSRGLGMDFTGIDLKVTPEGKVYCFEVNPCPAYSFYEEQTGQPIARAVGEHLVAGEPGN